MHWFENLFHFSLDGGNGVAELITVLTGGILLILFFVRRHRKAG